MSRKDDWFKVKLMFKSAVALYILYAKVSLYTLVCKVFKKEFPERVEVKFMDVSARVRVGGSIDDEILEAVEEGEGWKVCKRIK